MTYPPLNMSAEEYLARVIEAMKWWAGEDWDYQNGEGYCESLAKSPKYVQVVGDYYVAGIPPGLTADYIHSNEY